MLSYNNLSEEIQKRILNDRAEHWENPMKCRDENILRRDAVRDVESLWRPAFVRDIEKIMHLPLYNRYADKTQVFSFYRNDDITRRALHVQLVSRIARNIGALLGLNLDLIEAIALGHDIGHTPFGHAGERFLNELYQKETGRFFLHNVHSVRVLDQIFSRNVSLQALDGILCHNGEMEQQVYRPSPFCDFALFDQTVESCYTNEESSKKITPYTLEGCVVRVCDMIAYLGKDRQDARKARIISDSSPFTQGKLGVENAQIINNLTVDIVEHSYGGDAIVMDEELFQELKTAKRENNAIIYRDPTVMRTYNENIEPMFCEIYSRLLRDLKEGNQNSVLFRHHIDYIRKNREHYKERKDYLEEEPNQIVVDYIASMTDDYFLDLYDYLDPKGPYKVKFISYFDDLS